MKYLILFILLSSSVYAACNFGEGTFGGGLYGVGDCADTTAPIPTGAGISNQYECESIQNRHWADNACYYCDGDIYSINETYQCLSCPLGWTINNVTGKCDTIFQQKVPLASFGLLFLILFVFVVLAVNNHLKTAKVKKQLAEELRKIESG